ncbi:MAG: UbiX family flavin prenyltransferase [Candidatus Odinarchaeia archaeon]
MELIIAITGASGVIYGIRLLEVLRENNVRTLLVVSNVAKKIIDIETDYNLEYVLNLADLTYTENDFATPIISGSSQVDGMVIVPCSMKTLSAIANGFSYNVIIRAADCMLKEGKPLILVPRETPLNYIHLKNMATACKAGAVILPAMPGFYFKPKTVRELVDHIVGKILDSLKISNRLYKRWMSE